MSASTDPEIVCDRCGSRQKTPDPVNDLPAGWMRAVLEQRNVKERTLDTITLDICPACREAAKKALTELPLKSLAYVGSNMTPFGRLR